MRLFVSNMPSHGSSLMSNLVNCGVAAAVSTPLAPDSASIAIGFKKKPDPDAETMSGLGV
jgi:hypothetical protein